MTRVIAVCGVPVDIDHPCVTMPDVMPSALLMSLYRTPRFRGLYPSRYDVWSVLHHSILAAYIAVMHDASRAVIAAAATHDVGEVFIGDIPAPIKNSPMFESLREIERHLRMCACEHVIFPHVGIDVKDVPESAYAAAHHFDRISFEVEVYTLFPQRDWYLFDVPPQNMHEALGDFVHRLMTMTFEMLFTRFFATVAYDEEEFGSWLRGM